MAHISPSSTTLSWGRLPFSNTPSRPCSVSCVEPCQRQASLAFASLVERASFLHHLPTEGRAPSDSPVLKSSSRFSFGRTGLVRFSSRDFFGSAGLSLFVSNFKALFSSRPLRLQGQFLFFQSLFGTIQLQGHFLDLYVPLMSGSSLSGQWFEYRVAFLSGNSNSRLVFFVCQSLSFWQLRVHRHCVGSFNALSFRQLDFGAVPS